MEQGDVVGADTICRLGSPAAFAGAGRPWERWNSPATDIMPFAELGLSPDVLRHSPDVGYNTPTPFQAQAIPVVLTGRDPDNVSAAVATIGGSTRGLTFDLATAYGLRRISTTSPAASAEAVGRTWPTGHGFDPLSSEITLPAGARVPI